MNGTRWIRDAMMAASRRLPRRVGLTGIALTLVLASGIGLTLKTIVSASAEAAGEPADQSEPLLPSGSEITAAIHQDSEESRDGSVKPPLENQIPLEGLQRDEAVAVLNDIFRTSIEEAAGIYDELQSAELLGSHVAVLPEGSGASQEGDGADSGVYDGAAASLGNRPGRDEAAEALPEAEARRAEGPPPKEPAEIAEASLLDSTVPLEVDSGETIDLSLEPQDGHLEPVAPLVQSQIPGDLSEKIELPEAGIGIEVAGSTAREASVTDGTVAFYPNVAEDSDLAISPTPTGVETLSQLRSADSPNIETYRLSLPADAELTATEAGGAEVHEGKETLLTVPAPSAVDAEGGAVPVDFEVSGNSLQIHVDAGQSTAYPVLVDPLFQTYEWAVKDTARGICSSSTTWQPSETSCSNREEWGYEVSSHYASHLEIRTFYEDFGIVIEAREAQTLNDHATVVYTVPRYFKEAPHPTSFIKSLQLSNVKWQAQGPSPSPYLLMGIWDSQIPGWVQVATESGQIGHGFYNPSFVYNFAGKFPGATEYDREAKVAAVSVNATETTSASSARVNVGAASVELGDEGAPKPPEAISQTQWVNQTAPPINFTTADYGLGVYAVTASTEEVNGEGKPLHTWKAARGCVGVGDAACPQIWDTSKFDASVPGPEQHLTYDPAVLPSGINYLVLVAEDPVGNKSSSGLAEARVDHIAPNVALSGSISEQDSLGTRRSSYTLKATASDGNAEHPQSGIAKAEVKLDGKTVAMEGKQAEEWSPKCTSRNCPLSAEWTLNTAGLVEGKHTIEVIATDAVGNATTKTLTIETHVATAPTLALSGSSTEQASLGTSRPRYILKAKSSAISAGFETPTLGAPPTYSSTIGSFGEANGQFSNPADVAVDSLGNVWVVDKSLNRVQEFTEKGEWLRSAGGAGSTAGKLSSPSAIDIDPSGHIWVADTANNRVVEYSAAGAFLETFGSNVNKTKVEAGGSEAEKNFCTAASGNTCQAGVAGSAPGQMKAPLGIASPPTGGVWVVDTGNNRLEKFTLAGANSVVIGSNGSGPGQLKEPSAIAFTSNGWFWVADTGNNRIEEWNAAGGFERAVGKEGAGDGEFKAPVGIAVDATGGIWVGDRKNNRVEEFDEAGNYIGKFGSTGGGTGQFSMSERMGLATDPKGSIWVTDGGHFNVQHWVIPGFPVYNSSVGSAGSGNGQFMHLAGVASDSQGHVWALDQELGRVQEFNEKGEWLQSSVNTGYGKLNLPQGVATDSAANVWVADTGNNRIVKFGLKGEFLLAFGTNVDKTKVEAGASEAEKNVCTAASGDVCQAAASGAAAGQLSAPKGIAVTPNGKIWVADTGNNRLEKFSQTGGLILSLSGPGSEPGKLKEPSAVTVAPDGSIWVADSGNNRIQAWNSSLTLIHTIGKEGSGGGEFKAPAAIFADSSGNIWVGDQKNNRVEEFGEGGRYRGQFGVNGSGTFSFSAPMGLAVDNGGTIWIADPGHSKIQKWVQEVPRSEITTTLWIDGNQQAALHGTCKTAGCTIEPQWTVGSAALEAKAHIARVKTTDGLGLSTESTVNFQIARDTTKPALETSGELVNAPGGWLEQETYGLNATATDAGYGITSITFKVDNQVVASTSQSCADGGCKAMLSKQISMAPYSGGSHPAEVIATDGAGNSFTKRWTINVDPEGHISTKEAEATLEAVESTSEVTPVAPTADLLEPSQMELGDNPGLHQEGSKLTSTGVPDVTTLTTTPSAGFTINSPYGETTIVPVVSEGASTTTVAEGVAAVSANVGKEADSVIRPEYNGVQIFQEIRSEAGQEKYSWNVHLNEGQTLRLVDSSHAEVVFDEGGKRAFLIDAEKAHDANGTDVPTHLEVSGKVLTLVVELHKGTYVYPVEAGAGWETAYRVPLLVEGPENEIEIEEREKAEQEGQEITPPPPAGGAFTEAEAQRVIGSKSVEDEIIPVPDPPASGEASASSIPEKVVKPYKRCSSLGCSVWWAELRNPSYHYKRNENGRLTAYWQNGTQVHAETWYPGYYWPELEADVCGEGSVGPGQVWSGEHEHLTAWMRAKITATAFTYKGDTLDFANFLAMQIWVWPNGFQQRWNGHWEVTPQWIESGGGCALTAM